MRQTSLLAYGAIKDKLGPKQKLVFEALEDIFPANDKALAAYLNWPINTITPRRGELFKKHKIVIAFTQKDQTGRSCTFWKPRGAYFEDTDVS